METMARESKFFGSFFQKRTFFLHSAATGLASAACLCGMQAATVCGKNGRMSN
jgi:hypothetical protein